VNNKVGEFLEHLGDALIDCQDADIEEIFEILGNVKAMGKNL